MSRNLLGEIEEWKLEAKLEDSTRYFYHTRLVERLENGKKCFVIGRKGTGKTAISEHLCSVKGHNYFSKKLTFKNFPFNVLYELSNSKFNTPNQYITLWKYVIYSSVAKCMIKNEAIDTKIRNLFERAYREDLEGSLSSNVTRWTGVNFKFTIFDAGIELGANKEKQQNEISWVDRVEIIEQIILNNIDDSKYLVIFDELDEDYKDIIVKKKYVQYTALLTSLFKAVQDIKSKFNNKNQKIFPVIFLRDDIYDIIQDPDKTKWNDLKVSLDWTENNIKNLLAFRISRALNSEGPILPFGDAWKELFLGSSVSYGHRQTKKMNAFNFIARSTHLRPRDFIRYLQVAAEETLNHPDYNKIGPSIIVKVDKSFSNYLRSELEDEIHGVLPDIKNILGIFSKIRKQILYIEDFKKEFEKAIDSGEIEKRSCDFVLSVLFHFSVIGNQPKQKNIQVFRYVSPEANLNFNEKIVVHRGLFKALQIL